MTTSHGTSVRGPRVAVLSSARSPGLDELIAAARAGGELDLALLVVSDASCVDLDVARDARVLTVTHDIRAWHRARGWRWSDLTHRAAYDSKTLAILRASDIDVVVCLGYVHVLSSTMLSAFPGRIVNVHDSDLARCGADGRPMYRGLRSTFDAIAAGETYTHSTAHVVTEEVDVGPIVARSTAFPVHLRTIDPSAPSDRKVLKAYARAHREWMMRTSWGPLALEGIRAVSSMEVRHVCRS